jgi:hypothetical protein
LEKTLEEHPEYRTNNPDPNLKYSKIPIAMGSFNPRGFKSSGQKTQQQQDAVQKSNLNKSDRTDI